MRHRPTATVALGLALSTTAGTWLSAPAEARSERETAGQISQPDHDRPRHHGHGRPGRLLDVQPMAESLWPENTAAAYRISYVSSDRQGHRTVVTGSVYVPSAPYQGKGSRRPVISWAHETTGLADNCAPSVNGQPWRTKGILGSILAKGYLVVSSDYEGLGTPGEHPFLIGESEAHGVIDIVRAVQQMKGVNASRDWLAAGHSQGGQAALFTAAIAPRYGKGLNLRGTFASAPITGLRLTVEQARPFDPQGPGNAFLPLLLGGLDTVEPDLVDESQILTAKGMEAYRAARTNTCFPDLAPAIRAGRGEDFYHFTPAATAAILDGWERHGEVPIRRYSQPVFIAQGTADTTVYPVATQVTANRLKEAGTDTTFTFYPGAAHGPVQEASLPDLLAFAHQRFH